MNTQRHLFTSANARLGSLTYRKRTSLLAWPSTARTAPVPAWTRSLNSEKDEGDLLSINAIAIRIRPPNHSTCCMLTSLSLCKAERIFRRSTQQTTFLRIVVSTTIRRPQHYSHQPLPPFWPEPFSCLSWKCFTTVLNFFLLGEGWRAVMTRKWKFFDNILLYLYFWYTSDYILL